MSLEAWGDEGDLGPEGYVTEELYDEQRRTLIEAVGHLTYLVSLFDLYTNPPAYLNEVRRWLDANTVNGAVT